MASDIVVRAKRALQVALRLEQDADLRQRSRIARIELDGPPEVREGGGAIAAVPLDGRQLAIQHAAVG